MAAITPRTGRARRGNSLGAPVVDSKPARLADRHAAARRAMDDFEGTQTVIEASPPIWPRSTSNHADPTASPRRD